MYNQGFFHLCVNVFCFYFFLLFLLLIYCFLLMVSNRCQTSDKTRPSQKERKCGDYHQKQCRASSSLLFKVKKKKSTFLFSFSRLWLHSEDAMLFYTFQVLGLVNAQQISTPINSFFLIIQSYFQFSRLNYISSSLLPLNSSGWYKNFRCCHIHWEVKRVNVNNRRKSLSVAVIKSLTECT